MLSGSVAALEALEVWPLCRADAAPLTAIRLIDDTARLLRAPEVMFAAAEIGLESFGHNVENRHLIAALEGNLISPWLTSRAGELNTVAVFVSILFWGWMWGLWGLVLAVPMTVALKAAADHIEQLRPIGELLSR